MCGRINRQQADEASASASVLAFDGYLISCELTNNLIYYCTHNF